MFRPRVRVRPRPRPTLSYFLLPALTVPNDWLHTCPPRLQGWAALHMTQHPFVLMIFSLSCVTCCHLYSYSIGLDLLLCAAPSAFFNDFAFTCSCTCQWTSSCLHILRDLSTAMIALILPSCEGIRFALDTCRDPIARHLGWHINLPRRRQPAMKM